MVKKTLEQKVARVKDIYSEIKRTEESISKADAALHKLVEENRELEGDIDHHHLLNKERIEDPLLDFCFRHFSGYMGKNQCVLDMVPKVENFLNYVKESEGEKVLVVENTQETGIISGPCQFEVEEKARYLHIPVEKLLVLSLETGKWDRAKPNLLYINPDIFLHPSNKSREGVCITDHSKLIYTGGPGPKETFIYIGNSLVEKGLKEHPIIIPAKEQKIGDIPY